MGNSSINGSFFMAMLNTNRVILVPLMVSIFQQNVTQRYLLLQLQWFRRDPKIRIHLLAEATSCLGCLSESYPSLNPSLLEKRICSGQFNLLLQVCSSHVSVCKHPEQIRANPASGQVANPQAAKLHQLINTVSI